MKNWYKRNKKILIGLLICFIGLVISVYFLAYLVLGRTELVELYYQTGEIPKGLGIIALPGMITFVLITLISILFIILLLRTLFPKSNAFNILTMKSDRDFIKDLPRKIRKEMSKHE